jgi:uncharacterized protein YigE (DUF2233 family)
MKHFYRSLLVFLPTICLLSACDLQDPPAQDVNNPSTQMESAVWKEIRPGMRYAQMHLKVGTAEDFKDLVTVIVDPKKYSFSVAQNPDFASARTIKEIHQDTGSILTFNGGFFTEEFKPTGLLISEGTRLRKTSEADLLDGILAITDEGEARLFGNKSSLNEKKYTFAIQNGPVLLDENGAIKISKDTGKTASRTAIGLDDKGNIVLIILKQSLLNTDNQVSLYEFAHLLKESPDFAKLNLRSVLNLDGGPSTGMMVMDQYYPEMEKVQNVVIVKNRNA